MGSLASRLKEARKALGLTQEMVSRATGIKKWRLSQFESGKRDPRLAELRALAECYRQPLMYFLREEEPKPQPVMWCQIRHG
jgi:transcriptional regulator with XRE-family HTH domain